MIVPPGFNSPFASASSIIFSPIRSLTLPPGFIISSLASARQGTPAMILGSLTKGVFPIVSRMLSKTRIARPTPTPTLDEKDGRYKNVRGCLTFEVLPIGFGSHQLQNRSRCESKGPRPWDAKMPGRESNPLETDLQSVTLAALSPR